MKGGVGELAIRFAGAGTAKDFKRVPEVSFLLSKARVWQSRTPLCSAQIQKKKRKKYTGRTDHGRAYLPQYPGTG